MVQGSSMLIFIRIFKFQIFKCLWKSSCVMKINVSAWLLLSDRLNTRALL
jgi:hypothetical protein